MTPVIRIKPLLPDNLFSGLLFLLKKLDMFVSDKKCEISAFISVIRLIGHKNTKFYLT